MKTKMLITLEIIAVFSLFIALRLSLSRWRVVIWERQNLGWVYTLMLLFMGTDGTGYFLES